MRILIKTKNLEHSEALENFINKKFETLNKIFNLSEVIVEVEKETKHHKKGEIFLVKSQVILFGKNIMAEERADDLFVAVTKAKDEMKNEVEKLKMKNIDKNRRQDRKLKGKI